MDPRLQQMLALAMYDDARRNGYNVGGYDAVSGYDQVGAVPPPMMPVRVDRRSSAGSQYGAQPSYQQPAPQGYPPAPGYPPAAAWGPQPFVPYPQAPLPNFQAQSYQAAAGLPGYGKPVRREEDLGPLPTSFAFGPATAQTITFELKPYRTVLPVVLTVDAVSVGAPGCLVLLQSADIAGSNQLAGQQPVSIARYAPLATTRRLQWAIITPQVPCYLTFITTAAPAAMTSITISPTLGVVTLGSFGQ